MRGWRLFAIAGPFGLLCWLLGGLVEAYDAPLLVPVLLLFALALLLAGVCTVADGSGRGGGAS